jgi:hypothetical protein
MKIAALIAAEAERRAVTEIKPSRKPRTRKPKTS